MDNDNVGFQMGRYTSSSNSHITYSGGSQPFDNRKKIDIEKKMLYSERLKIENNLKEKETQLEIHSLEKEKLLQRIQELEKDMNKKIVNNKYLVFLIFRLMAVI